MNADLLVWWEAYRHCAPWSSIEEVNEIWQAAQAAQRLVSENCWQKVKNNNLIVAATLKAGGDISDCVIALAQRNGELVKRIIELENIAPRKMKVGDQVYIWRCPDHLIPFR